MRKVVVLLFISQLIVLLPGKLFPQSDKGMKEFGITTGGLSNFPANKNYMTDYYSMVYIAPYVRAGQHEFSAGITLPLSTKALYFTDDKIDPRPGFTAGYKFFLFDIGGQENLFIHYMFQYLRFKGSYDKSYPGINQTYHWTETDMYINNVIGLGYNLFFDSHRRFGLYYTLDYVITQQGFKLIDPNSNSGSGWLTNYIWNNLSTHFGLIFKITSLNKKETK
jgi:hypothetical protein